MKEKKKVLIIEDDQIFANIYRNKLLVDGFEVEVAYDGEAGFNAVKTCQPDAILLDLILPQLSGVELIKRIRAEAAFKTLPLIVLSNTYLTSTVQEAWKAGASKCLAKANCTPNQVLSTLKSLLNGQPAPAPASATAHASDEPEIERAPETDVLDPDDAFQADLRKQFVEGLPGTLLALRSMLQGLFKAENEAARLKQIGQLHRKIHTLTGSANIVGLVQIAQLTDALEALLKELHDKPAGINASTTRSVATAVDFLGILFSKPQVQTSKLSTAKVLVVDDEPISRRAVTYALDKARLKHMSVDDPLNALQLLNGNKFDLIFLDVDMPNMNGFELCSKIRSQVKYKNTPVVFITSLNDFESRTNSTVSGGNDFIAKPFLFVELAVKALVYVLRAQGDSNKK